MLDLLDADAALLISVEAAKLYLKVDHDAEDDLIKEFIGAAQDYCERATNRALTPKTYSLVVEGEGSTNPIGDPYTGTEAGLWDWGTSPLLPAVIDLPRPPFIELVSATLVSPEGNDVVLDLDTLRVLARDPGQLRTRDGRRLPGQMLTVVYRAGYEDAARVPRPIVEAMRLLMGHWYENREAATPANRDLREPPFSVQKLLDAYREVRVG